MHLRARAERIIPAPPEVVFDFITAPGAVARTFGGFGPIPRALRSYGKGDDGPLRAGSIRVVENADGSIVEEEILELTRPDVQAYRLVRGLPPAFAALVHTPSGRWTLSGRDGGTRVEWVFTFPARSLFAAPFVFVLARFFAAAMRRALAETERQLVSSS